MFILNGSILRKIAPQMDEKRAEDISDLLNEVCPMYGINSATILHEFLANVLHESNEFSQKKENLNYSAKRLMQIWASRFRTLEIAQQYANNPINLAEKVYGNRKDLGNIQNGDGWKFRGSGFIQITGRANFVSFTNYMRQKFGIIKTVEDWAEAIRNEDKWALHSACYIFAISMKLIDAAIANNMTYIVKRINGGYIGLDERKKYYGRCVTYIK